MGGLTSAVDWWEEWQLRVLVLTSMAIQFLLLILSFLRRYAIPRLLRSIMWLAYLAGDAVAIYALATLFNRHKVADQSRGDGSPSTLELIWVPILLIHLGGHDSITAYNIEDNELWSRHLLTGVAQVTVAIYVFCKSWPSGGNNRNLLSLSILLFISGVFKCLLKPLALKRASIYSIISSTARKQNQGEMYPLEEYVKRAKDFVDKNMASVQEKRDKAEAEGVAFVKDDKDHSTGSMKSDLNIIIYIQYLGKIGILVATFEIIYITISVLLEDVWSGARAFVRGFLKDDEVAPSQGSFCGHLRERLREARKNVKERRNMKEPGNGDHPPSQGSSFCGRITEKLKKRVMKSLQEDKKIKELIQGPVEAMDLFVDLSSPYDRRLTMFRNVWALKEEEAYDSLLRRGLAGAFLVLYTKLKTAGHHIDGCGQLIMIMTSSRMVMPCLAIGLFHTRQREAQDNVAEKEKSSLRDAWPEKVAQYSLIGYYARIKRHRSWMWVPSLLQCKDLLNQHWRMKSCFSSRSISKLVLGYLKEDGWRKEIKDVDAPSSYRRFNDHSSRWVLERNYCSSHVPGMAVRMKMPLPFDESVLLWHIATDICFFFPTSFSVSEHICASAEAPPILTRIREISSNIKVPSSSIDQTKSQCRQISNYMVYLLFVNPEMLLPGTRRKLFITAYKKLKEAIEDKKFATACKEIKDILKDKDRKVYRRVRAAMKEIKEILRDSRRNPISWSQWKPVPVKNKGIMERVISTMLDKSKSKASENVGCQEESKEGPRENFIDDAWALAQGLLDLGQELGDEKMWEVIQAVWVEMLCYSASRCRGYLHAKALGEGGEFLSYVWLLLFHMGMETFTDKLQREHLPSHEAAGTGYNATAGPRTSTSKWRVSSTTGGTAASASEAHADPAGASDPPSTPEIHLAEDKV